LWEPEHGVEVSFCHKCNSNIHPDGLVYSFLPFQNAGIWLSSDNKLVDGGIASAPEVGTFNSNFGWGLGIEQIGVKPDYVVDNDPRETFDGIDRQLEEAIQLLSTWLQEEPVRFPQSPPNHNDMSLDKVAEGCPV
jgi:hypothetical protein